MLQQEATAKLRRALRLPRAHPHLAHWLFAHKGSAYHPALPLLPPAAFAHALAIRISHVLTDLYPAHPFATPYPIATPASSVAAELRILHVPARFDGGFMQGYCLARGEPFEERLFPFNAPIPPQRQLHGRFVFDTSQNHLVCVINQLTPALSGIISIDWLAHNRCERLFFTVPNDDYSFRHLPTRVLALLKNFEYKVEAAPMSDEDSSTTTHNAPEQTPSSTRDTASTLGTDAAPDIGPKLIPDSWQPDSQPPDFSCWCSDFLSDQAEPMEVPSPPTPSCPNPVSMEDTVKLIQPLLSTDDSPWSVAPPAPAEPAPSSSSALDMSSLTAALAELETLMAGKFFAPRLRRDVMDPYTGEVISRHTSELRATLQPAPLHESRVLREIAAQAYYASALAVSTDRLLTHPPRLSPKDSRPHPMLAPKPVEPVCQHCQHHVVEFVMPPPEDAQATLEAKKEAKRRKNRLSAARSNLRRKEREQAQEKELVDLKERAQVLRGVEEKLRRENIELKRASVAQH